MWYELAGVSQLSGRARRFRRTVLLEGYLDFRMSDVNSLTARLSACHRGLALAHGARYITREFP
jgi:hypothetical protein